MKDGISLILDAKEVDIVIDALDCYVYMASSLSEVNKYIEINTVRNHIYEKCQKEFDKYSSPVNLDCLKEDFYEDY